MLVHSRNWLTFVFALRGNPLLRIWPRLLMTVGISCVFTFLHWRFRWITLSLTPLPFTLVGVALGIFLGFRNNASYERFWEGRRLWGQLVNISRSLTRQILTLIDEPGDTDEHAVCAHGSNPPSPLKRELVYRLIAYVHALRLHLRNDPSLEPLRPFLPARELESLAGEVNRPVAILQSLGGRLMEVRRKGWMDSFRAVLLENGLVEVVAIQGGCERIKSTPIPFSYNVLMHQIVALYCLTLPFGILDSVGLLTPAVVGGVAYAFFGLDAIGDEVEEPFGTEPNDLPLDTLSRMVEVNLRQRLGETELPPLLIPEDRVLR